MRDDRIRYFAENMGRLSRRDRIFLNNPVIMQGLGLAPIIVPATTVQNALILAVAVALLLTPTRIIATLIGRRMNIGMRAILYSVVSAGLFFGVMYIMDNYLFWQALNNVGIFLPLLVLEPLIIKRYERQQRERISTSFKKGIITTVGFCLVLFIVATARELLGYGTFYGIEVFKSGVLPIAAMPAGGLIIMGLVAALWRGIVFNFKKRISMGVKELQ